MSNSVWLHRQQPTRLLCTWDSPGKNTGVGCHFLLQCMKVKSESEVTQLCPTLHDPMDCSLPGSSVHGIFQARALEWGAIAFSCGLCTRVQLLLSWKVLVYGKVTLGTVSNEKTGQSKQKERPIEGHETLCESKSVPYWGLVKRLSYKGKRSPPTAFMDSCPNLHSWFFGVQNMSFTLAYLLRV